VQESDDLLNDIYDCTKQIRKWIKKFDLELTKNSEKKRVKIGMVQKELYKAIRPKINFKLSQGQLHDMKTREKRPRKDICNAIKVNKQNEHEEL